VDGTSALWRFLEAIRDDPCIGPSHISLFLAISYRANLEGWHMPIRVFAKQLMSQAKICGLATYSKCIRDLQDRGYIRYISSCSPATGSQIYISS